MGKMDNNSSELQQVAQSEAAVWDKSPYYEHAEDWTWLFWSEDHPFRKLFDRLDLSKVLELACGFGRHAEYALNHFSDKIVTMTIMDILESNVKHCQKRLATHNNVTILRNNGTDFLPVKNSSLTAIYCYDAMVHFNQDVVKSYLKDSSRVLAEKGRALFHHSNYQADPDKHFGQNPHARAFMSSEIFKEYAEESGLKVCEQVVMNWGEVENIDCITLVEKGVV